MAHFLAALQMGGYRLQTGGRLTPSALRALAHCLDRPAPELRRVQGHPVLALHLALATAADWLAVVNQRLALTAAARQWFAERPRAQVDLLTAAVSDAHKWSAALQQWRLEQTVTIDLVAFALQRLAQLRETLRKPRAERPLRRQVSAQRWLLTAQTVLEPAMILQLYEWADYQGADAWLLTPAALARALAAGLSLHAVTHWLTTSCGSPLSSAELDQLTEWAGRGALVRVEAVHLLTVAQPEQLNALMAQRALRRHVYRRLSPRHAVAAPALIEPLRRHLLRHDIPLTDMTSHDPKAAAAPGERSDPNLPIALHVLIGLRRYLPIDLPDLPLTLAEWTAAHSDHERSAFKAEADRILDDLRREG